MIKSQLRCLFIFIITSVSILANAEERLLYNVNGYGFDDDRLVQFSLLHIGADGRIKDRGTDQDLRRMQLSSDLKRVDMQGAHILPGLIDAHGHILNLGFKKNQLDLTGVKSLQEAQAKIQAYAKANPALPWIKGRGWNQELWSVKIFPTAADIDKVVDNRPVWLTRIDGHAAWANSKAMQLASVTKASVAPAGGEIIRYSSGEPTGIFVDQAEQLIEAVIPPATSLEIEQALNAALRRLAQVGITSVHDAGVNINTISLYKKFIDEKKLSLRVYAMLGGLSQLKAFGLPLLNYGQDQLQVRSVKLYIDGALGSRGAALLSPYDDSKETQGLLFHQDREFTAILKQVLDAGYQANVHAIGDAGNRLVLNTFSKLLTPGTRALRHRIEHAQVVALDDIPRFKSLDLIASMQPTHATSDKNMAEKRVGAERIKGAYAWSTFLKQGTLIASGSDFPVESSNPFYGLHAAVTRQDLDNQPPEGWYKNEAMTLEQALYSFTQGAAFAAHQEAFVGGLKPGQWADYIVVDRDIFAIPASSIAAVQVQQTYLAGRLVYQQ